MYVNLINTKWKPKGEIDSDREFRVGGVMHMPELDDVGVIYREWKDGVPYGDVEVRSKPSFYEKFEEKD